MRYYFLEVQPNQLKWIYGPWQSEKARDDSMRNHKDLYPLREYLPFEKED
jgi:hypothetical protein